MSARANPSAGDTFVVLGDTVPADRAIVNAARRCLGLVVIEQPADLRGPRLTRCAARGVDDPMGQRNAPQTRQRSRAARNTGIFGAMSLSMWMRIPRRCSRGAKQRPSPGMCRTRYYEAWRALRPIPVELASATAVARFAGAKIRGADLVRVGTIRGFAPWCAMSRRARDAVRGERRMGVGGQRAMKTLSIRLRDVERVDCRPRVLRYGRAPAGWIAPRWRRPEQGLAGERPRTTSAARLIRSRCLNRIDACV